MAYAGCRVGNVRAYMCLAKRSLIAFEARNMLEKLPESVGHALQGRRAGFEHLTLHKLSNPDVPKLAVDSTAFHDFEPIPMVYTADGMGLSPPISWRDVPEAASHVVLIVEDADSPTPQPLVHAIAVFAGRDGSLQSGDLASPDRAGRGVITGLNSFLKQAWLPPDPPPGHGLHRYVFQVFALGAGAELPESPGRGKVAEAVAEHALAAGYLIGVYSRERLVRSDDAEAEDVRFPLQPLAVADDS